MNASVQAAPAQGPTRAAAWLLAVWCGALLAVAVGVAPLAFELFSRPVAGAFMGRLFAREAPLSCAVAVVALVLYRQGRARLHAEGSAGGLDAVVLMIAGVLFCTVAGHYGLQPMMERARTGAGPMAFGTAHGASMAFFAIKIVLLGAASWRAGR